MLPAEQIKQIATLLKVDETKLTEAIKSDKEETIDIAAGLQTVTEDDLTRIKNAEYSNGKEKGVEMKVKDLKEKLGLDFQGKTIEGLVEAASKKSLADAKIEPAEKVKELQKDLEILRSANETLKGQITEKDGAVNKAKIDREIFKHVPKSDSLTEDEFIGLMRMNGYDFKYEGNDLVAVKGDGIVKDNLAKPIPVKDVIATFAKEKKLSNEEVIVGGRGGVDKKTGATFTKLSELKQHYTDQNKSTQGEEFLNHASKLKEANPEFDFNS
jgi:peptidoglycan hydrolase-like protein with peptidoglycan-binding domain